jgi:hypothetical protein|tara:strand:+ start:198 stop:605 length:408 start_codon:yes stop_codon:yes gene_type:complete
MWTYENKLYDEAPKKYMGFVYLITDLTTNRKYIGKKLFWNTRKLKPLKGKTRRRTQVVESNWKNYYGSNEELQQLVENSHAQRFEREILHLCTKKGIMSYLEAREQFDRNVLLSDEYYNNFIGCKIHGKHVAGLK